MTVRIQQGFTLIETVLAVAIVASTLLVVITVLGSQSKTIQDIRRTEREFERRDQTEQILRSLDVYVVPKK